MAEQHRGTQSKYTSRKPQITVAKDRATAVTKAQKQIASLPLYFSLYRTIKRWSNLSQIVSSLVNFKGFSRDGVATIYVFVILGLCVYILLSSRTPIVIKMWAVYRLGAGFKAFAKFLTR
jgi:hypothetical protein